MNGDQANTRWVPVRHSAFGYTGDPRFERGLEVRGVTVEAAEQFSKKGVPTFLGYKECYDWCFKECHKIQHPKSDLYPNAQGMFLRATVDGLQVYVPNPT